LWGKVEKSFRKLERKIKVVVKQENRENENEKFMNEIELRKTDILKLKPN
jgi:predicted membrane chloride channel (bestrophin family)